MDEQTSKTRKTFTEEIEVMGNQLVQQVKDLFNEGNVRQVRLKASDGDILFETPLTFGVVAGGAVALAAPWLAILGAIAAFVTHVKLEVIREADDAEPTEPENPTAEADAKPEPVARAKPETKTKAAPRPKSAAKAKAKPSKAKTGKTKISKATGKTKAGSKAKASGDAGS